MLRHSATPTEPYFEEESAMPHVIITTRNGTTKTVDVDGNGTLMEAIRDNGVSELQALCAGCCSCATCHVYVDPAFADRLSPMSDDENELLDGTSYRQPTSRLSCQVRVTAALDGLRATVAPED
jgi:2Fe-2S ferredoxin